MSAAPDDVLLLACYELGHQPLSLAWPAAVLRRAGVAVTAVDLAVDPFPRAAATRARFVGISVPMHTALRLGVRAAQDVRALNPDAHICFYGLYAWLNADYLLATVADSVLAGEVEEELVGVATADRRPPTTATPLAAVGVETADDRRPVSYTHLTLPASDLG